MAPPLECPRDLSLLGPYFLGIPGETLSLLHICPHGFALQETTAPKALCVAALGSALVCQQL